MHVYYTVYCTSKVGVMDQEGWFDDSLVCEVDVGPDWSSFRKSWVQAYSCKPRGWCWLKTVCFQSELVIHWSQILFISSHKLRQKRKVNVNLSLPVIVVELIISMVHICKPVIWTVHCAVTNSTSSSLSFCHWVDWLNQVTSRVLTQMSRRCTKDPNRPGHISQC